MMVAGRWHPWAGAQTEMEMFDDLPPRVRRAISECPLPYTGASIWHLMKQGYTAKQVIQQMRDDVACELGCVWNFS